MTKKEAEEKNQEEVVNTEEEKHVDVSEEEAEAQMLAALEKEQSKQNVDASVADFPQFDESKKKSFLKMQKNKAITS